MCFTFLARAAATDSSRGHLPPHRPPPPSFVDRRAEALAKAWELAKLGRSGNPPGLTKPEFEAACCLVALGHEIPDALRATTGGGFLAGRHPDPHVRKRLGYAMTGMYWKFAAFQLSTPTPAAPVERTASEEAPPRRSPRERREEDEASEGQGPGGGGAASDRASASDREADVDSTAAVSATDPQPDALDDEAKGYGIVPFFSGLRLRRGQARQRDRDDERTRREDSVDPRGDAPSLAESIAWRTPVDRRRELTADDNAFGGPASSAKGDAADEASRGGLGLALWMTRSTPRLAAPGGDDVVHHESNPKVDDEKGNEKDALAQTTWDAGAVTPPGENPNEPNEPKKETGVAHCAATLAADTGERRREAASEWTSARSTWPWLAVAPPGSGPSVAASAPARTPPRHRWVVQDEVHAVYVGQRLAAHEIRGLVSIRVASGSDGLDARDGTIARGAPWALRAFITAPNLSAAGEEGADSAAWSRRFRMWPPKEKESAGAAAISSSLVPVASRSTEATRAIVARLDVLVDAAAGSSEGGAGDGGGGEMSHRVLRYSLQPTPRQPPPVKALLFHRVLSPPGPGGRLHDVSATFELETAASDLASSCRSPEPLDAYACVHLPEDACEMKASPGGGKHFPEAAAFLWRIQLRPGHGTCVIRLQYSSRLVGDGLGPVLTMHFLSTPMTPTLSGLDFERGTGPEDDATVAAAAAAAADEPWSGYASGIYAALPSPTPGSPIDCLTREAILRRVRPKWEAAAKVLTACALLEMEQNTWAGSLEGFDDENVTGRRGGSKTCGSAGDRGELGYASLSHPA